MKQQICYFFQGSPILDYMNAILRKIIEAGLFKQWKSWHYHDYILKGFFSAPEDIQTGSTHTNPLSLLHLQTAFLILGIGLTISSSMFIFELFRVNLKSLFNKK